MLKQPQPGMMAFSLLLGLRTAQVNRPGADADIRFLSYCARHHLSSSAQLFQDLLVLFVLGEKRNGFFVEFGATDGVDLSNSLLLERKFGWRGVLAEPAVSWHGALQANRTASIDKRCVWSKSGERLAFNEPKAAALSTLDRFSERDYASHLRRDGSKYPVETVSLNDLLDQHGCPRDIDYISVDTEGAEFDILQAFDFSRYRVGVFTVEHNKVEPDRQNILALMARNGYGRVFEAYSGVDDWYVHRSILDGGQPASV